MALDTDRANLPPGRRQPAMRGGRIRGRYATGSKRRQEECSDVRLLQSALAALVVVALGTACGATAPGPTHSALPSMHPQAVGSARVEIRIRTTQAAGQAPDLGDLVGTMDFAHQTAQLEAVQIPDTTTTTVFPGEASIFTNATQGPTGALLVDSTLYSPLNVGPIPLPESLSGKHWISQQWPLAPRLTSPDPADRAMLLLEGAVLPLGPATDPGLDLDAVRPYVASATRLGTDDVHGSPATEYRVIVDSAGLSAALLRAAKPGATAKSAQDLAAAFSGPGHPLFVWLDPRGRALQVQLTYSFPTGNTLMSTVSYWDFGVPVQVSPPPADEVVSADQFRTAMNLCQVSKALPVPTLPTFSCGSGGSVVGSQSVTLPTVHGARSTLQFRPVLDTTGTCARVSDANPDPGEPVTLPGAGGLCFDLGRAQLVVSRASVTGTELFEGSYQVNIALNPEDSSMLDSLARTDYQSSVALVAFGKVLAAPTINSTSFHGSAEISGLSETDAERVVSALTGA